VDLNPGRLADARLPPVQIHLPLSFRRVARRSSRCDPLSGRIGRTNRQRHRDTV